MTAITYGDNGTIVSDGYEAEPVTTPKAHKSYRREKKSGTRAPHGHFGLKDFFTQFPNEEAAVEFVEACRFGEAPFCGHCGGISVHRVANEKPMRWRCRECRKYFSVRTGTIFAETNLPLETWLLAIYLMNVSRHGISALLMRELLNVSHKTAWFLDHRIREAMRKLGPTLEGIIQIDETWIGGQSRFMHKRKKKETNYKWTDNKTLVVGLKQQDGPLVVYPMADATQAKIEAIIKRHVKPGSTIWTDSSPLYSGLRDLGYDHHWVNHNKNQYVKGDGITTNEMESWWAALKRIYKGTFQYFGFKHLPRYLDEFEFRANNGYGRNGLDVLAQIIENAEMRRLTYKQLTKEAS